MLEPKTLKLVPVPDLAKIPVTAMRELLDLIGRRLAKPADALVEKEIDKLVLDVYGLSVQERRSLGIED